MVSVRLLLSLISLETLALGVGIAYSSDKEVNTYGLSSRVDNLHHGIKDGKYTVDSNLVLKNSGNKELDNISWNYSLCFDAQPEKGLRSAHCVAGGSGGKVEKFLPGQESSNQVHIIYRAVRPEIEEDGDRRVPIKGLVPHIKIDVGFGDTYRKIHDLPPIGDYK